MKFVTRLALLGLATALGCAPAAKELSPADLTAIQQRFDEVARNVTAKDYIAWSRNFTNDGLFMFANSSTAQGREAIQNFGNMGPKGESLSFSDVQIHGSGNFAWATSAYRFKVEGAPTEDVGKQLVVLQRQEDGSWLVQAASVSSDLPATAPPPTPAAAKK